MPTKTDRMSYGRKLGTTVEPSAPGGARQGPIAAMLGTSLLLAAAPHAFADDGRPKAQPVAVDLDRLSAELDFFAAEERRERWAGALTGLGVGGIMLPTGIILLKRADGASRALAIGLIVGG